jgi:hypothetical protein
MGTVFLGQIFSLQPKAQEKYAQLILGQKDFSVKRMCDELNWLFF